MEQRILFVDDEPQILQAYKRTLRKNFKIVCAEGGREALEVLSSSGPFAVIVSDMKMPEMNGAELLYQVKNKYPLTIRLMLTGNADQQTAVDAINTADVFKFINKPCPPIEMIPILQSALKQYDLQKLEQKLLEDTVKGSIKALVATLSIVSPERFGRAATVRNYMLLCAKKLTIKSTWELEAVALLSQIGLITLPDSIIDLAVKGGKLTESQQNAYDKHPETASKLINKIPRLEAIAKSILYQNKGFDGSGFPPDGITGKHIPLGARLLKPLLKLVAEESKGFSKVDAFGRLTAEASYYDPEILSIIEDIIDSESDMVSMDVSVTQLSENMIIAQNIYTESGLLLIGKGQLVSSPLISRLYSFWQNKEIPEKVKILFPQEK